jgi:BASS family bile acid:Na+ symporter
MGAFGLAVVAAVIAAAVWSEKDNVLPALARAGGPALLVNVLSVCLAWGASALLGLHRRERIAVGLECGLQNFAMAAFIALTLLADASLLMPALAYGLTMWLSAGLVVFLARRATPATDAMAA